MTNLDFFGAAARLHHIGLAVTAIQAVNDTLEQIEDPRQKVAVAFCEINGVPVELVAPLAADSPVTQSLKKGNRLLHLCYEVPDLHQAVAVATKQGFHQISQPVPAVAFDGRNIVWLFHSAYGLFELLEAQQSCPGE